MRKLKSVVVEILGMVAVGLGFLGTGEASSDDYMGGNHGGNVSNPPYGSVISEDLSTQYGMPVALDSVNNTYYMYVVSHWFDPQQMAEFPPEVWMYGQAPYDHGDGE